MTIYDGLNRVKSKTPSVTGTNPTLTYNYDPLGRITSASAVTTAHTITNNMSYTYNAQGPIETDEQMLYGMSAGKKTSLYDAASRRA